MQARLAMADRLIAIGTLAAGVAHELNTPLAWVSSNLEFVRASLPVMAAAGASVDEVGEAVAESLEGTERLRLIIEDLRAFARAPRDDAGPADLEAVLRSCVSMTWNEIRHRAVLERDVGTLPPVAGNPARLSQVFVNLLVNAAHAIPPGHRQGHRIRLSARVSGDAVTVEVEDTGTGIPPAVLPRVFDPFFTTRPAGEGTGLGLSISRSIVAAVGGSVELGSQPGRGTVARVRLPVAVRQARPRPPPPVPATRRGRVLVVDDERLVGSSLRRLLGAEHEVTVVGRSRMALRLVEQGERFDAIIADVMMPDLTGVELQEELARLAPGLARRMVFVTAGAYGDDVRTLVARTGAPLLFKPASRDDLLRALAGVMPAGG
jgi:CheY-like chemotaxis protein